MINYIKVNFNVQTKLTLMHVLNIKSTVSYSDSMQMNLYICSHLKVHAWLYTVTNI